MVSSKKLRGKQRRAAKSQAAAASNGNNNSITMVTDMMRLRAVGQSPPPSLVAAALQLFERGDDMTTNMCQYHVDGIEFHLPKELHDGALSIVLKFLQKCEDESFDGIMKRVGGSLKSPSSWIFVVNKIVTLEKAFLLQIVESIGPLIRCMCNDTARLFFKSKKCWGKSILPFMELTFNLLKDMSNEVAKGLFREHEGLLRSIVQWKFWGEHRPDIVNELGDDWTKVAPWCKNIMIRLVQDLRMLRDGDGHLMEESRSLMEIIGTTPIVSKGCNPTCMISCVAGLIHQVKSDGREYDKVPFDVIKNLILDADCIDKGVIIEIIDYGTNITNVDVHYNSAILVAGLSAAVLLRETNVEENQLSDTRIAYAIRAGLIEMCLKFIELFGGHEYFERTDNYGGVSLYHSIRCIFGSVLKISMHQKSWKAIRHKKNNIKKELLCLEQGTNSTNNDACKQLLDMVRSILDRNGAYCCRCNKLLGRRERKQCDGCNTMTYCSVACQKEDWLDGGHKQTCKIQYDIEQIGQFQGRLGPLAMPEDVREAAKLKELEINTTMIQLKLFLDHSETILSQASALGIPLYDCVVIFDLRHFPVTVKVLKYADHSSMKEKKCFEASRSKDNIICIYRSFNSELGEDYGRDKVPNLFMQRFFPHAWLSKK